MNKFPQTLAITDLYLSDLKHGLLLTLSKNYNLMLSDNIMFKLDRSQRIPMFDMIKSKINKELYFNDCYVT